MVFDYCAGLQHLRQSGTDIKGWRDASDAGVSRDSCTVTCGVRKMGSSDSRLKWRKTPDGLVITCPNKLDFATSLVFKIIVQ